MQNFSGFYEITQKTVYDTSVFEILDNNLCLYIVDVNKVFLINI